MGVEGRKAILTSPLVSAVRLRRSRVHPHVPTLVLTVSCFIPRTARLAAAQAKIQANGGPQKIATK